MSYAKLPCKLVKLPRRSLMSENGLRNGLNLLLVKNNLAIGILKIVNIMKISIGIQ